MMAEPPRSFPLAPMSRVIILLTAGVLAVPVALVVAGLLTPARSVLLGAAAFVVVLCAAIWLFARPTGFEVSSGELVVIWPLRHRVIPRTNIASARVIGRGELRKELGWAIRVGVGGLWGAFGSLWTSRRGSVEVYVSRTDGLVWIERRVGRPLLITPTNPEGFLRALGIAADASKR